jgi:cell division transport system ATP-binding protein
VADEPTGNLDRFNTDEVIGRLLRVNEIGTTVVLASHEDSVINSLERRVIVLEGGKIVRDDPKGKYEL